MALVSESDGPTDAELARRVLSSSAGQAQAAEHELCRRFAPRVRLYGLRHLQDEHAADDLVQRALELVITKLRAGQVREPERIASFVLGVARMQAHDMRRRARRERPVAPETTAGLAADSLPEPRPLEVDQLARCLDSLGERERSIVLLSFFDQQTGDEIAGTLAISAGNVRVIRHRAVERLRKCMGLGEEAT